MSKEQCGVPTNTPTYAEGALAFRDGVKEDDCPYLPGKEGRVSWLTGWTNARLNSKLGHIFRKYNVGML